MAKNHRLIDKKKKANKALLLLQYDQPGCRAFRSFYNDP